MIDSILSERLIYRPIRIEDIETYLKFRNEKSYRQWFYFQEPLQLETAINDIKSMHYKSKYEINLLKESFDAGIYMKGTGELVGTISLNKFHGEEELEHVEIGYGIGEAYQNNGFATEAAIAAVTWGLERLHKQGVAPIIHGNVEHENWPSRRVLEKAGFHLIRTDKYLSIYEIKGK